MLFWTDIFKLVHILQFDYNAHISIMAKNIENRSMLYYKVDKVFYQR